MTARPETKATQILRRHSAYPLDRIEPTQGSTPGFPDTVIWVRGMAVPVEIKRSTRLKSGLRVSLTPVQRLWWRNAAKAHHIAFGAVSLQPDHEHWALLTAKEMLAIAEGDLLTAAHSGFPVAEFDANLRRALTNRAVRA